MLKFLGGLGIGVLVGMVVAPERGSDTRRKLMDRAGDMADKLPQQIRDAMPDWGQMKDRAREMMPEMGGMRDRVLDAVGGEGEGEREEDDRPAQPLSQNEIHEMAEEHADDRERRIHLVSNSERLVDILNNASKDELMSVKGIGPTLAARIIRHRPYDSVAKVMEENVLPEGLLEKLEQQLANRRRAA
jgi:gas vesicle protein